ncbi:MAG: copper amine oxidase N-terminal domain-containing protein [Clostridiales bacterium]|jgi:hypothetical protein|nr:copper amine oxidase N-terminal domain-containing protein [Clostridiales bacterium]
MFRNKKAVMLLFAAIMAVSAAVFFSLPEAEAADAITILIDGRVFQPPDAQPFISSDRVMVPFRPIGEAMGATADWAPSLQKVTMSLRGRNVEFVIGGSQMSLATTDSSGGIIRTNITLDAPAMLVNNNRAFVPIRAVSEGLGATVEWIPESRTVVITSPVPPATPTPVYTPTPAINPVFADTTNFERISGTRAQFIFDNDNREIVLYFDSTDSNAVNRMQMIMQAARTVNAKVLGVDIRTSVNLQNMSGIYSYVDRNSIGPALLFYYGRGKVITHTTFSDQTELNSLFENWYRNYYATPTPIRTPTPTGTITPTAAPVPEFSSRVTQLSKYEALDMYDSGDRFVLLRFNSEDSDLNSGRLEMAIDAVNYAVDDVDDYINVYYMDEAEEDDYYWFGEEYYDSHEVPNPCIFYVEDSEVDAESRFTSYESLAERILYFLGY